MGFGTVASLVVMGATTAMSFAQAAEEAEKKKKAEAAAAAAMSAARDKLDVNFYDELGIKKEPYELARDEMIRQGAMAVEALREGDPRALAAGVGRIQLAQQKGQQEVATQMQKEMFDLDLLRVGEETRLRDLQSQIDLQEAAGAQQAMADAERAEQQAIQQGVAGLTNMAGTAIGAADLYGKSPEVKAANRIQRQAKRNKIDTSTLNMSDPDSLKAAGFKLTPRQWGAISKSGASTFDEYQKYVTPIYTQGMGNRNPADAYSVPGLGQDQKSPQTTAPLHTEFEDAGGGLQWRKNPWTGKWEKFDPRVIISEWDD